MADFVRRIVSGNKARFKDNELNLELDLVYVTDRVIIMGYPAAGVEGLYRNRKEDAIRFLEHRHGKNYWVFNFCPIKENSYNASLFGGRVSRYPFPDHHAPPLAIMPLVAREMNAWLQGSPERVAVLHCKAGKGRSGTMACTYLVAHDESVTPPQLIRDQTAKESARRRIESAIEALPPDEDQEPPSTAPIVVPTEHPHPPSKTGISDTDAILEVDKGLGPPISPANPERSFTDALKGVLDLHTARRMKPPSEKDLANGKKSKQGVSIPSQRRFLYYWALLLAHDAPKHMWAVQSPMDRISDPKPNSPQPFERSNDPRPKVRLTQLKLRMRETSGVKLGIVKAANRLIEKTSMAKGPGIANVVSEVSKEKAKEKSNPSQVWISLARYDDSLVNLLEDWEVYTRDESGSMGARRKGSEHLQRGGSTEEEVLSEIFNSGKWDGGKMVRSFARMGITDGAGEEKVVDDKEGKVDVFTLKPLSDKRWQGLKYDLEKNDANNGQQLEKVQEAIDDNAQAAGISKSEANSMEDVATTGIKSPITATSTTPPSLDWGIILDAGREIRLKLYMGQVFMGWLWFIPTFHMPQPPPSSSPTAPQPANLKGKLVLTRKEIDFPLGLGSSIIDVEIEMEWVVPPPSSASTGKDAADLVEPPVRARTDDSKIGLEEEPQQSGVAAAVQAVLLKDKEETGGAGEQLATTLGLRQAVEAKQGADAD